MRSRDVLGENVAKEALGEVDRLDRSDVRVFEDEGDGLADGDERVGRLALALRGCPAGKVSKRARAPRSWRDEPEEGSCERTVRGVGAAWPWCECP